MKKQPGKAKKTATGLQFRERRFRDIDFKLVHPKPRTPPEHHDTLPLPFGGEVKKYDMKVNGLMG